MTRDPQGYLADLTPDERVMWSGVPQGHARDGVLTPSSRPDLEAEWLEGGRVKLDTAGKLAFPQIPSRSGAYELRLAGTEEAAYVGETDNLRRRSNHYRNPDRTQQTNIRMNEQMRRQGANGGHILLRICTSDVTFVGEPTTLDLEDKAARRLVESAHILHLSREGVTILNA
jgi:hypothetical protein